MSNLIADMRAYEALQKEMGIGPNRTKWVKGANGLWHSFDPIAQRKRDRAATKAAKLHSSATNQSLALHQSATA